MALDFACFFLRKYGTRRQAFAKLGLHGLRLAQALVLVIPMPRQEA